MIQNRQLAVLVAFSFVTTLSALALATSCPLYLNAQRADLAIVSATRDGEALDLQYYRAQRQEIASSMSFRCYPTRDDPEFSQILIGRPNFIHARFEHERCFE